MISGPSKMEEKYNNLLLQYQIYEEEKKYIFFVLKYKKNFA